jgi:hypothetical protein
VKAEECLVEMGFWRPLLKHCHHMMTVHSRLECSHRRYRLNGGRECAYLRVATLDL